MRTSRAIALAACLALATSACDRETTAPDARATPSNPQYEEKLDPILWSPDGEDRGGTTTTNSGPGGGDPAPTDSTCSGGTGMGGSGGRC